MLHVQRLLIMDRRPLGDVSDSHTKASVTTNAILLCGGPEWLPRACFEVVELIAPPTGDSWLRDYSSCQPNIPVLEVQVEYSMLSSHV